MAITIQLAMSQRRSARFRPVWLLVALSILQLPLDAHADQLAAPASAAVPAAFFNWIDHASPGMTVDNIHLLNPGATESGGRLVLAGRWEQAFQVAAGGEAYLPVPPGLIGGPLRVLTDRGPAVIASQRVVYRGTISEVAAVGLDRALSHGYFTWYDLASAGMTSDNIHLLNPGSGVSTGRLSLPGAQPVDFSVGPGEERYYSFPRGSIGGPVSFEVLGGPALIASQRTAYLDSFTETPALDPAQAATALYFNWYDRASPGVNVDDIHLLNPGATVASGVVSAPGLPDIPFAVGGGAERFFSWPPGTVGGPVTVAVRSGPGVLATQRLAMPPLFTEWAAQPASAASPDSWFNWYDRSRPDSVDELHFMNPGPSIAAVRVSLAGAASVDLSVGPGQNLRYSYPGGTIGGPVHIQVAGGAAVVAAKRSWLMPAQVVLAVPYLRQQHELTCEEASLRMALAYRGIPVTEEQILAVEGVDLRRPVTDSGGAFHWGDPYASFVGDPDGSEVALTGYGAYASVIRRAAVSFGASVIRSGEGISPSEIYSSVQQGHPVIAWVSFDWRYHASSAYTAFDGRTVQFGAPFEHAVTVVGVSPDAVLVNNPWSGPEWRSKGTFELAYASFNQMAVVIS